MHRFVRKSLSLTQIKRAAAYSPTQICSPRCFLQYLHKSLCTGFSNIVARPTNQQSSFTIEDLINSCRFSHIFFTRMESSKRPYSVLKFLQNDGFSRTQIETIVSKYPDVLFSCVEKTLKPKLNFFRSFGFSEADTVRILTVAPCVMHRSLKKHIIPSFELLSSVLGDHQNAVDAIKCNPLILWRQVTKNLAPNVEILRTIGTPDSQVMKIITTRNPASVVAGNAPRRFRKDVEFLMEMGFDPRLSCFVNAVNAKGCLTELGWEEKLKFFRSLGFSNEEIIYMFKKQPMTMATSKERIRAAVEFYISSFHWSLTQLSNKPNILRYSLGKRIIPRCSVLQILTSRSMINKSVMVSSLLVMTEGDFLDKYITNYKDEAPELLDAYHGKLKFDEYNFDPGTN